MNIEYPVVVGIDFGTTYTGCAYAFIQNEEVVDIVRWPKQNNNVYPKTPTLNFYQGNSSQMTQWGNAARVEMQRPTARNSVLLKQYKLYLDENIAKDLPPLPNGLTIVEAIADYLKAFHEHVVGELKKGFARNYGQHQFRYCLTVPAMWSDRAKNTMRDAAIKAGLIGEFDHRDRLMLISEPEAAALYCEKKCEQFNLRHGDKFMICDAGGGTVDLIVFEIDEHSGRKLKESTKGHGQSCGSVFLDRRMRKLLKKKFKEYLSSIPASAFETMMDTFVDLIKPQFDGIEDQFISLPASMNLGSLNNAAIGLEEGMLCLTANELRTDVFEPVVKEVLNLIEDQLVKAGSLQAVFLVGGFGSSNYLFERVQNEFGSRIGLVAVPPRCELAVVRGAVYFGLNPRIVTTRIPRYWYGIDTTTTFEEGIDPPNYKIIRADGSIRCDNRFSVYVTREHPLDIDNCVSKDFFAYYPHHTTCTLYAADTEERPRYTTSPGVRKVANFTIPMPALTGVMEGEKVDLSIKMYFGEVELRVEAVIRGKTYGEEEQAVDNKYHWNHPLKGQLEEGLSELWNSASMSFERLDGTSPNKVEWQEVDYPAKVESKRKTVERIHQTTYPPQPISYQVNPIIHPQPNQYCSLLQLKHQEKAQPMDDVMKRYFRAVSILEHEHEHGSLKDDQFEVSMVGNSCWVPSEKKKFFLALERCGKRGKDIAKRIGPTKTEAEVVEYLHLLQTVSRDVVDPKVRPFTAREMSPICIAQEEHMAALIQDKLQVESYGKHLEYVDQPQNDLFELWNMSSLTRIFAGINDMTVLSSSTINFHELIKQFVSDVVIDLHTELLKSTDKTVTKKLVNIIIGRRQRKANPDKRLSRLNAPVTIDRRFKFHDWYTEHATISYLAKRRRALPVKTRWDDRDAEYMKAESDSEDEMLKPFDKDDTFNKESFAAEDEYAQYCQEMAIRKLKPIAEGKVIDVDSSDEEENMQEERELDQEDAEELEMQKLDQIHEKELIQFLGFYDENSILNREKETLKKRRLQ
ncbi:hypothetical protein MFLAVUS_011021 [Mucor flavus]|uniref:Uncharacterized protein n=1 Tax=Mucor flavus TaxID=439312 RepID=A0ABP9ZEE6_9FUNG